MNSIAMIVCFIAELLAIWAHDTTFITVFALVILLTYFGRPIK